jgi:hypothetical protein
MYAYTVADDPSALARATRRTGSASDWLLYE